MTATITKPSDPVSDFRRYQRLGVRAGSQIGTIDALIAQLCIRHGLMLLTTDQDFLRIKKISALQVWQP